MVLGAFVGEVIDPGTFLAMTLVIVGAAVTITSRNRPGELGTRRLHAAGASGRTLVVR